MTKEEIIQQINDLEFKKIKLIGKLELLEEQEKERKNITINDVKENGESTGL